MNQKAIEERRRYMRDWRRNNPDKVRDYQTKYWERRASEREEKYESGKDAD